MDSAQTQPSKLSEARAVNQETIALVAGEEIQQLPKDPISRQKHWKFFSKPSKGPRPFAVPDPSSESGYFAGSGVGDYRSIHGLHRTHAGPAA